MHLKRLMCSSSVMFWFIKKTNIKIHWERNIFSPRYIKGLNTAKNSFLAEITCASYV